VMFGFPDVPVPSWGSVFRVNQVQHNPPSVATENNTYLT